MSSPDRSSHSHNAKHHQGQDQRSARGYRADIDGLRSLAVLPIVFFHLGFSWIPGGYVGVDIFFVISGYLIGGIILSQIHQDRYSIIDFYVRRFRRIMPALIAMLAITTLAMLLMAFPRALVDYSKSLIATALFGSNIYFWRTSDYFAPSAETQSLLHTWSLAVEEQYYLIFPILMLIVARFRKSAIMPVVTALAAASLALSAYAVFERPVPTFFLLPTRFWELLLGVIAVRMRLRSLEKRSLREFLTVVGLAMVTIPILIYTPEIPFPGLAAVPPCLGTALLLLTGAHGPSLGSRILAIRPLVFVGLISYSLYLWHWPVVVLLKQWLPTDRLNIAQQIGALALSFATAWLSWRVIERPWRDPSIGRRTILTATACSIAVTCLVGALLIGLKGIPQRFPANVQPIIAVLDNPATNDFRAPRCFPYRGEDFSAFDQKFCLRISPDKPNILLMGDSHAAHLWTGLNQRFPQFNFQQATAAGCAPLLPGARKTIPRCVAAMHFLFDDYLPEKKVRWVLLAGYWNKTHLSQVARTLNYLHSRGFKVILAGPIVRYAIPLPQAMAMAKMRNDPSLPARMRERDIAELDRQFEHIAREHGAIFFSLYRALCKGQYCQTVDDRGLPLQYDYGHLTRRGSLLVAQHFPASVIERQSR